MKTIISVHFDKMLRSFIRIFIQTYFFQIWAQFLHSQKCNQNVHLEENWSRLLTCILKPKTLTADRKDRNELTLLITADKRSHGDKTASQRYLASFVLQSFFCFDSFTRFSAFVLVVWAVLLLLGKPGFVLLLRVFERSFFSFILFSIVHVSF